MGIQKPDIGDAEMKVVDYPLVRTGNAVLGGEYLDTDKGRLPKNLTDRLAYNHTHVGHPEAGGRYLNALLRDYADAPLFAAGIEISGDCHLQAGVIECPQIPLLDLSVHVVAIRLVHA